jgi:hypothetical protein
VRSEPAVVEKGTVYFGDARGYFYALDADTGELSWRYYTVPERKQVGTWPSGAAKFEPSGVGVWSSPVIDPRSGTLFVGTGQNHTGSAGDFDTMLAQAACVPVGHRTRAAGVRVVTDTDWATSVRWGPVGVRAAQDQARELAGDAAGEPRGERHGAGGFDGDPELLPQAVAGGQQFGVGHQNRRHPAQELER